MYIFREHNTSFCLYIKYFHCIRFHLVFRISFTNICLYTLDFYVNHENTIQIFIYISLLKYESTIYNSYYIKKTTLILENGLLYNFTTFTKVKIKL